MPGSRSLHMGLGMSRENGMSMSWGFTREGGYTRGQGRYTRRWEGARVYQSGSGKPRVESEGWVHQIVAAGIPEGGVGRAGYVYQCRQGIPTPILLVLTPSGDHHNIYS